MAIFLGNCFLYRYYTKSDNNNNNISTTIQVPENGTNGSCVCPSLFRWFSKDLF